MASLLLNNTKWQVFVTSLPYTLAKLETVVVGSSKVRINVFNKLTTKTTIKLGSWIWLGLNNEKKSNNTLKVRITIYIYI